MNFWWIVSCKWQMLCQYVNIIWFYCIRRGQYFHFTCVMFRLINYAWLTSTKVVHPTASIAYRSLNVIVLNTGQLVSSNHISDELFLLLNKDRDKNVLGTRPTRALHANHLAGGDACFIRLLRCGGVVIVMMWLVDWTLQRFDNLTPTCVPPVGHTIRTASRSIRHKAWDAVPTIIHGIT